MKLSELIQELLYKQEPYNDPEVKVMTVTGYKDIEGVDFDTDEDIEQEILTLTLF